MKFGGVRRCRASNPPSAPRRVLGAERHDARGRADDWPAEPEHSWRDRSGNRPDPDAGSSQGYWGKLDFIAPDHRNCASHKTTDSCLFGQCELPPCNRRTGLVERTRTQMRLALHPSLLPAPRSHRAMLGCDALLRHPQPGLPDLPRVQASHPEVPQIDDTEELGVPSRPNNRQLPRHLSRRFSGHRAGRV